MTIPYGNDSTPPDPTQRKLLHRTQFRRNQGTTDLTRLVWQWFWSKQSPNGQTISVGGEGYDERGSAFNGYFASEGFADWTEGMAMPEDYVMQKFADDHWVITKYGNPQESQHNSGE